MDEIYEAEILALRQQIYQQTLEIIDLKKKLYDANMLKDHYRIQHDDLFTQTQVANTQARTDDDTVLILEGDYLKTIERDKVKNFEIKILK